MLHIYVGPMYAGKTTKLLELSAAVESKCIVDYQTDGVRAELFTHDGCVTKFISTQSLATVPHADTLFINEAQFFTGLKEFVVDRLQMNTTIYLFGLDGCSSQQKFGELLDLVPYCDSITKLTATCTCGNPAIFSKRLTAVDTQYLPFGEYAPRCRKCF